MADVPGRGVWHWLQRSRLSQFRLLHTGHFQSPVSSNTTVSSTISRSSFFALETKGTFEAIVFLAGFLVTAAGIAVAESVGDDLRAPEREGELEETEEELERERLRLERPGEREERAECFFELFERSLEWDRERLLEEELELVECDLLRLSCFETR